MNKNLFLFFIFVFFCFSLIIFFFIRNKINIFDQQLNKKEQPVFIKINNSKLKVELAKTFSEKAQGLSGRKSILDDQGMLFVFKKPGRYPFWMKKMNFSIDIIWLDKDLKIVEINKEVQPESFPELLYPSIPVQYVLEVKSGWADENNVKKGDKCFLTNN